jgi:hypothetical protein
MVVSRDWSPLPLSPDAAAFFRATRGELPPERPAYARITVPGDGRIWVWPNQPLVEEILNPEVRDRAGLITAWRLSTTGSFDVFSETGEWLAVVRLPSDVLYSGYPTTPYVVVRGDTIWAVAQDSLGVQYLGRYQVDGLAARERSLQPR